MLLGFECLNIQYVKTLHPIIMKLTVYTKTNMRMLYINFPRNLRILPRWYNFRLFLTQWADKTFLVPLLQSVIALNA